LPSGGRFNVLGNKSNYESCSNWSIWINRCNSFFIKILKDELILAYTTASSEAVLPKLMEKMEKFGCPKAITSFVISKWEGQYNADKGEEYFKSIKNVA